MGREELEKIEKFYNALNETQKQRVESKIKVMLKESYETLPQSSVDMIRWQVATDLFKLLGD